MWGRNKAKFGNEDSDQVGGTLKNSTTYARGSMPQRLSETAAPSSGERATPSAPATTRAAAATLRRLDPIHRSSTGSVLRHEAVPLVPHVDDEVPGPEVLAEGLAQRVLDLPHAHAE